LRLVGVAPRERVASSHQRATDGVMLVEEGLDILPVGSALPPDGLADPKSA
jgi:hypothetical protein